MGKAEVSPRGLGSIKHVLSHLSHLVHEDRLIPAAEKSQDERDSFYLSLVNHPQLSSIAPYFLRLQGTEHETRENIETLEKELLKLAGFENNMAGFIRAVKNKTTVITFIAGAGTRLEESYDILNNLSLITKYKIKRDEPRGLIQVDNLDLGSIPGGNLVPNAAYNLLAVKDLGSQIVVYGGKDDQEADKNRLLIKEKLTDRMGVDAHFIRQQVYPGQKKPIGHGDALFQILFDPVGKKLLKKKFVITNFGSDANSYQTTVLSLLSMYVFDKFDFDIDGLMPTSISDNPEYPVYVDKKGLPVGTFHKKDGLLAPEDAEPSLQSNVGIRIFKSSTLKRVMRRYEDIYRKISNGNNRVRYPNDEFKIDHIERDMMSNRGFYFLTLPISISQEVAHTIKAIEIIPYFLKDMMQVLMQDEGFKKRHNIL